MARPRSGKPTMTDVAKAAGCSQTTVSIVLNHVPGFSIPAETRRRVAEAAVALGYRPHPAPRHAEAAHPDTAPRSGARPPKSFTDRVARALAIDILSDRPPQGAALPSDQELMAEFGVSRTVLREALKMLAGKGLIEARARVGTKVRQKSEWHLFDPDVLIWQAEAGLDGAFVEHLGEMRIILEPEAAALAARRRTAADLELLRRLVDRMRSPGITGEAFAKADLDFHLAVSAAAGNPFLRAVSALIEVALIAAMRRSWPGNEPGGTIRSAAAHGRIADAIECGDAEAARAAMRAVIDEGTSRAVHV